MPTKLVGGIAMISAARYDGVSANWSDRAFLQRLSPLLRAGDLTAEGQCYPSTVDDLKPAAENAVEFGVHHLAVQADVRPRRLEDCLPLLEGWQRIADDAGVPLYVETHRDRMTNDLHFTLDLLDRMPTLKLLADVSHYVVAREFAWPVTDQSSQDIRRIMDRCWAARTARTDGQKRYSFAIGCAIAGLARRGIRSSRGVMENDGRSRIRLERCLCCE